MVVVGIPVYHSRDTLPRALDSLVSQTKKMFMVMIVNDADGEDYSDIIERYTQRGLKIRYVVQRENKGPGAARQRVIDESTMCQYIMFLDSDDMYTPVAIEVMTRAIQQRDLDVIMGNSISTKQGGEVDRGEVKKTSITWVWNKIYKRQYLIDNNIRFSEELKVSEDIAFSLPAWHCTEKAGRLDQDIYYWCDNKNSLTRKEGHTIFDVKNIDDFVKAQCIGLKKIAEINGEVEPYLLIITLNLIYSQVQIAMQLGATEEGYIDTLKSLKEIKNFSSWKDDKDNWRYLLFRCKVGEEVDSGDIIFYKERFIDWYNRCFGPNDSPIIKIKDVNVEDV